MLVSRPPPLVKIIRTHDPKVGMRRSWTKTSQILIQRRLNGSTSGTYHCVSAPMKCYVPMRVHHPFKAHQTNGQYSRLSKSRTAHACSMMSIHLRRLCKYFTLTANALRQKFFRDSSEWSQTRKHTEVVRGVAILLRSRLRHI